MKVALAYSGGLDTSAIIPWLIENYDAEVVAVVGDVGQDPDELLGIEAKALASGASACEIVDLKETFISDYAFLALKAGAVYEGQYLLGTALARPSLARAQVEVAMTHGCEALCHGCTGKGNDQVRFETVYAHFAPHMTVIAPWREWSFRSREDLLSYLREKSVPTTASATKIYSRDANLWHMSHEGGVLEDPAMAPPDDVWTLTVSPEDAPNTPRHVTITFDSGTPTEIDGVAMSPATLVASLNRIAGAHGVGRIDLVENRLIGIKCRGCYETPAGTVLHAALRGLEDIVYDRPTRRFREEVGIQLAHLVYDGQWFTPLRTALATCVDAMAQPLSGRVTLKLYKGVALVEGRESVNSRYAADYATFGEDDVFDQKDAAGFIKLLTLPSRIAERRKHTVPA